jgi:hypothetical protein
VISARLLPETITILTAATTTDLYGNTVPDWTSPASRTAAAYVRPVATSDEHADDGRDVSDRRWQLHTNDQAVTAFDRIVRDGVTYEVEGDPLVWAHLPGGRAGHTKLQLRRVDG